MTDVTCVLSPSRFDRDPALLHEANNTYIDEHDAELVFVTEVAREVRERALRHVGFGVSAGDESGWDDCAIVYSNYAFDVIHEESYDMGGTGRYARIVVFADRNDGISFVAAAAHMPARVEDDLAVGRENADTRLWRKAVKGLRNRMNRLRRKHKAAFCIIGADWNTNFQRRWVRALIKSIYPFWRNAWETFTATTHGSRLIDAFLLKGKVHIKRPARRLKDDKHSDHKPQILVISY